ncbi:OadG family protein [candidate division TA06 bacterium]|nr:OadG family protein [candidate division TA06 bacterium]
MADFTGMGGALTVCVISQSIVFIALAIMAGVIYVVGTAAGRNDKPVVHLLGGPSPEIPAVHVNENGEEEELTAIVMGALTSELGVEPGSVAISQPDRNASGPESSWRIVSLQEAAQRSNLK